MVVLVSLDEANGMSFNRRRQSSDRAVIEQAISLSGGKLSILPRSKALFAGYDGVTVVESVADIPVDGWFFAEDADSLSRCTKPERLFVFRWHRAYPHDRRFPWAEELTEEKLSERIELVGHSHERITREEYRL